MRSDILGNIEHDINTFKKAHKSKLAGLLLSAEMLMDACGSIECSWSGSFTGWHGMMYYGDFEAPSLDNRFSGEWGGIHGIPDGWYERTIEEVRLKTEELAGKGFSVSALKKAMKRTRKAAEELHTEIIISLSALGLDSSMIKEKEICSQIENYKFDETCAEYVRRHLPKTIVSRDTEALSQGTCIPPHLYYKGVAYEAVSLSKAVDKYVKLIQRLIRQINIKQTAHKSDVSGKKLQDIYDVHPNIYAKCHKLYEKGAYSEAVEKSFKVVRDKLRTLTNYETGSEAFGKGKLYIKGAAAQNVDEDFNKAVQFLTMAIDRFRNEKSHTSDGKIEDPTRAYQYLQLSSLAMSLLDNAEIRS